MPEFQISTESNLSNKSHDIRDLNAGKKQAISKAKLSVEIIESNSGVNDSPLTLDVGLRLERGPDGEWEVIWSKVKELGRKEKPKDKNFKPEDKSQFKPTAPFNAKPKLNPKPITVWRPKPKRTLQNGKTQPGHLISASKSSVSDSRRGDVDSNSELPPADSQSLLRLAQSMKVSDSADSDLIGADEPDNEILSSGESDTAFLSSDEPDESDESAKTSDGEEKLHQDIRLILQENTGNVSKKWGNSEQWVLELRDGRRVAVPIQISLPPGEVTEVLEEQTQLALVPLKCPDVVEVSSAQVDENDVLVEDWVLYTCSESSVLPNVGGLSPLSVEPLAFSLPLAMEGQEVLGVENPVRGEAYSEWFQSRFKGFDNFLGTSLKGLENRRAVLEKKARDLKSSGVKGLKNCMKRGYSYIEGVEELLHALKQNCYEIHAFTNYPIWYKMIEDKLKISRYLSWTFCSCSSGKRKPDLNFYLDVLNLLEVNPANCIFIDDRLRNVEAAVEVGIIGLHFKNAHLLRQDLSSKGIDISEDKNQEHSS
ncbi:flavin mononucleotide hydrolase 1 [Quercus suber]|uniref:Flavin mononucleotide hydrolase 1 n=1 Tax=Quercus suber TaxID=58331 RepID=A0AAW0IYI9_QUESU